MKKIMLAAAILVFGMVGSASALTFSDTEILNAMLAEGPIAGLIYPSSVTYSHDTPSDFEVPWDIVSSASLSISGYYINGNNDNVLFEQNFIGTLTPGGVFWVCPEVNIPSVSVFNISASFSTWSTGAPFQVTIAANGAFPDGILRLSSSTFELNYENANAPVPEPSTVLLMGVGLIGLVGYSRNRSNKKS